jgi:nicotinate-nucleotide adenylyltransferase
MATPDQRLRMVRSAVDGDPRFEVRDMEIRREGPSFTVDTVRELRTESPKSELYLLIGADQWSGFARWREPEEIGRLARIAVMSRAGERPGDSALGLAAGQSLDAVDVPVTRVDISATLVRSRVARGLSIRYLVPDPVRQIIEAENLYL